MSIRYAFTHWVLLILFQSFLTTSMAQVDTSSNWVWMSGNASVPSIANYGTQQVEAPGNTPGVRYQSASWIDSKGKLWLLGGMGVDKNGDRVAHNDLWRFDPETNNWIWMRGDDTGSDPMNHGTKGVAQTSNYPGARSGSISWTGLNGQCWLYGGGNHGLNDLWKFEPETQLWTWVNGSTSNGAALYGVKGMGDAYTNPGARGGSTSWMDKLGNLWLFGGTGPGYLNDLWKYTIASNQWTWMGGDSSSYSASVYGVQGIAASANHPGARENSAGWTDKYGNLWLFGGFKDEGLRWPSGYHNDLWKYDTGTNQWTWISGDSVTNVPTELDSEGIPSPTNKPGANRRTMDWVDADGNFWLYGSAETQANPGAAWWKYDPSIQQWAWFRSPLAYHGTQGKADERNSPGGRTSAPIWVDSQNNVWVFGGNRNEQPFQSYQTGDLMNDLWKFDVSVARWIWMKGGNNFYGSSYDYYGVKGLEALTNQPGSRLSSSTWSDGNGGLWMFGGGDGNDLWKYRISTNKWTWMHGEGIRYAGGHYGEKGAANIKNVPPGRSGAYSWKDLHGNFWLFGGLKNPYYNRLNDLWKYIPGNNMWTWIKGDSIVNVGGVYGTKGIPGLSNNPGARMEGANWLDKDGNFWLFGGDGYITTHPRHMNDLWKYTISTNTWTWMHGDNYEDAVGSYGMKGVASPTNKPGARNRCMSWTDKNGKFWLFGGRVQQASGSGYGYPEMNDLWMYDPASNQWTWIAGESSIFKGGVYTPLVAVFGSKGVPSPTNTPGASGNLAHWVDKQGNLWLYGDNSLSVLWKFDPQIKQWTWIKGDTTTQLVSYGEKLKGAPGNTPGARFTGQSWSDGQGNLWLYGGIALAYPGPAYPNDLWMIPIATPVYVTAKDGNWNDPATWVGIAVPVAGADIVVRHQLTANISTVCNTLLLQTPGTINVKAGISLVIKQKEPGQ